jgi:hypothetical protein
MNTVSIMSKATGALFFTLARMAVAVLLGALVVVYFIVALGVDEYKAIWTRWHS